MIRFEDKTVEYRVFDEGSGKKVKYDESNNMQIS